MIVRGHWFAVAVMAAAGGCTVDEEDVDLETAESAVHSNEQYPTANRWGVSATYSTAGPIDLSNMFFRTDFATNGRNCATCHDPRSGWTISAELAEELFEESGGLDRLFRIHDVGTRPDARTDNLGQRRNTYKPMIDHGLVRFGTMISATAEFEVIAVDDPYGFGTPAAFTRFRRPNPTSNEAFVQSLTWTGGPHDVEAQAANLVNAANVFHGQGVVVPQELREEAVAFQLSIFHAQVSDKHAGRLDDDGARGGPVHLSQQTYFPGINSGASFSRKVFDLFDAWSDADQQRHPSRRDRARAQIARGQEVFNNKTFIRGNGQVATCSGCHNTPNVGSSSTFVMLRVGTDVPTNKLTVPLITVRNKTTNEVRTVSDLGRALTTGLWNDIGRFKVQHLRGLAARAPYFHDGRARTLEEVVEHYEDFFDIVFDGTEKADLVAFLRAL